MKYQLTCADCGTESRPAVKAADARVLAESDGWQVGMRGSGMNRIAGWEDDHCPTCKVNHPRTYCDGWHGKCGHRSIYTLTRKETNGTTVTARTCGKHQSMIMRELIIGGRSITVEETPL